jgi:hypothetical protein
MTAPDLSPKAVAKMLNIINNSNAGRSVRADAQIMIRGLAAERDALSARLAEVEADLLNVCRREAEMIARHDARMEAAEAELLETKALVAAAVMEAAEWLQGQCLTEDELREGYLFTAEYPAKAADSIRDMFIKPDAKAALDAYAAAEVRKALERLDAKIGDERGDPDEIGEWGSGWDAALGFYRKTIRALIEDAPK